MINLCVTRVPGCCASSPDDSLDCHKADPISDVLIQSDLVAASAGRALLDDEQEDKEAINASTSLYGYLAPGSIVQSLDRVRGVYQAEVQKFSINFSKSERNKISAYSAILLHRRLPDAS